MDNVTPVKRGYFLPQELIITGPEVLWRRFGLQGENWIFSSAQEATPFLKHFNGKLDAVEFIPFVYQPADIPAVVEVAKVAQDYAIDLWLAPRLFKQIDHFPIPPSKYHSWWMSENGAIRPAIRDVKRRPDIDRFNPEAVAWLMDVYYETFLKYFDQGLLQGLFWPEEHHGANLDTAAYYERAFIPYWCRPSYSDVSLELWRDYCRRHNVEHEGKMVDKFPVHKPEMVPNGKGKTAFYPGYNVTPRMPHGSCYVTWPRNTGVWAHWDRYRCETFLKNYLVPLSRQMHQLNAHNPRWRGVVYFGSSWWTLPYEKFADPCASASLTGMFGAWGYQCAIDLEVLARAPEITCLIHEMNGLIADRLDYRQELFIELTKGCGKPLGLMVHGDSGYGHPICPREELARWDFIKRWQPAMLSMYSVASFYPPHRYYDQAAAVDFWRRLKCYQEKGDPFADESK